MDDGGVPEDGDEGACEDAGDGGGGGGPLPVEGGEDDRGESYAVDGVGVEGSLEDRLGAKGLEESPKSQKDDHETRDDEHLLIGGLRLDVADEDVVDEVGGGGEEPVVGGGDDFGEDGSHEEGTEELEEEEGVGGDGGGGGGVGDALDGAGGVEDYGGDGGGFEAVEADVGEDLAGALVDFSGGEECGAGDGEGDDDGLQDDGAYDPADDGAGGVLFGPGGEELLVHGLVAEEE